MVGDVEMVRESHIEGKFSGWEADNIYELDGERWQQVNFRYEYRYAYGPIARLWRDGSRFLLEVERMSYMIEVRRVD